MIAAESRYRRMTNPVNRMPLLRRLAVLVLIPFLTGPAVAAGVNPWDTKVEYSADSVVGTGERARPGRLWRTPTALRQDIVDGGRTQTVIVRLDRGIAWIVVPDQRMVVETELSALDLPVDVLFGRKPVKTAMVGRETIDGQRTDKYRVEGATPKGGQFDGFVWTTPDGVVMKIDGEGQGQAGQGRLAVSFRNVRVAPQDANLFEPPAGYFRMAVSGANLQSILQGLQQLNKFRTPAR
jgi:hypothetical protein